MARATAEIDRARDGDVALLFTYEAVVPFYERCGWQAMQGMRCLAGERGRPVVHEALAMMRFLSERGRRRRSAFLRGSVYIGEDPW